MSFSLIDIAVVAIILISLLVGLFRGFIREILSLISWVASFLLAYKFATMGSVYLEPYLDQEKLRIAAAFAIIFVIALIVISVISYLLYRLFAIAGISGVDRSLGTLFGLIRGIVIVALLILMLRFMDFTSQPWWKESMLVQYFEPVTELIRSVLPEDIAKFVKPA